MKSFLETGTYVLPAQVKQDLANRLRVTKGVRSIELRLKGDSLEDTRAFSRMLVALKTRGVRISHEFSIKLEFPRSVSRERVLDLVGNLPKSKNGSLKVRVEFDGDGTEPAGTSGEIHEG